MPNFDTTIYTQQVGKNTTLSYNPSMDVLQTPVRLFEVSYTLAGTEVAADKIRLGFPKVPNMRIIPELSTLSCPSGAGCAFIMTLKKCDTAGTETALTAAATQVAATPVQLARPATTPTVPECEEEDYLFLLLGTKTTATAGSVLLVQIAYASTEAR